MDNYFDEISLLRPEQIYAVHMNNADITGPSLEARKFCDGGVIDLKEFLGGSGKKDMMEWLCRNLPTGVLENVTGGSDSDGLPTTRAVLEENGCL